DELLSRIKNLLQTAGHNHREQNHKKKRPSIESCSFGNVSVNFETHEVLVNGRAVRLTPKELRLLRYFLENQNRVISRAELLSEVWEISGNLQTRAVDQTIARVRKVVEPNASSPIHLLTIRDAGYRFVADTESESSDGEADVSA
ncbi:MAG: response regulator transcription factor, partial [Planctomycetota bacterium]